MDIEDLITKTIRDRLEKVAAMVLAAEPSARVRHEKLTGGIVRHFVYCAFSLEGSESERIIVGVGIHRLQPQGNELMLDVCGEESGKLYWKHPQVIVKLESELLKTIEETMLCLDERPILEALRAPVI